jgi:hypothetical protein
MLFYFIGFFSKIIFTFFDFFSDGLYGTFKNTLLGLGLVSLNIYTSLLGGFLLAYCLMWRKFEKSQFKCKNIGKTIGLYVFSLIFVAIDIYLIVLHRVKIPILFYISVIAVLLYAIISNSVRVRKLHKKTKEINPFISLVGLGLGVYIATLIENLLYSFLPTVHYYATALYVVFTLAFLYHVLRLSREKI